MSCHERMSPLPWPEGQQPSGWDSPCQPAPAPAAAHRATSQDKVTQVERWSLASDAVTRAAARDPHPASQDVPRGSTHGHHPWPPVFPVGASALCSHRRDPQLMSPSRDGDQHPPQPTSPCPGPGNSSQGRIDPQPECWGGAGFLTPLSHTSPQRGTPQLSHTRCRGTAESLS